MERSLRRALSRITDSIRHAFSIWGALPKSNGKQVARSKESEVTSSFGYIFVGKTWIPRTKRHVPLSRYASSTLAVCCSLNAYARFTQKGRASRGDSIANKP